MRWKGEVEERKVSPDNCRRADKYADTKTEIVPIYHKNKGRYGDHVSPWYFTAEGFFSNTRLCGGL